MNLWVRWLAHIGCLDVAMCPGGWPWMSQPRSSCPSSPFVRSRERQSQSGAEGSGRRGRDEEREQGCGGNGGERECLGRNKGEDTRRRWDLASTARLAARQGKTRRARAERLNSGGRGAPTASSFGNHGLSSRCSGGGGARRSRAWPWQRP